MCKLFKTNKTCLLVHCKLVVLLYSLGLVFPLNFFEEEALWGDLTSCDGIVVSSESFAKQCLPCWPVIFLTCLHISGPIRSPNIEDTLSQPLASKTSTWKEELPQHVKSRRSFSCSSWALTKSSHPDMRNSSSPRLSTLMCHVLPLGAFSSNPPVICPLKFCANFSGML